MILNDFLGFFHQNSGSFFLLFPPRTLFRTMQRTMLSLFFWLFLTDWLRLQVGRSVLKSQLLTPCFPCFWDAQLLFLKRDDWELKGQVSRVTITTFRRAEFIIGKKIYKKCKNQQEKNISKAILEKYNYWVVRFNGNQGN